MGVEIGYDSIFQTSLIVYQFVLYELFSVLPNSKDQDSSQALGSNSG